MSDMSINIYLTCLKTKALCPKKEKKNLKKESIFSSIAAKGLV